MVVAWFLASLFVVGWLERSRWAPRLRHDREPKQSKPFVDFLEGPNAALTVKIDAVVATLNAGRKQRAQIRAWVALRGDLGREPSAAELARVAQTLYERNDTALAVTEEEARAYLAAGGTMSPELLPWNASELVVAGAPVRVPTLANAGRSQGSAVVPSSSMDADELFLATLDDLDARTTQGRTEYDVLSIAALLRKLLLDGSRLVDQVNRSRRFRLRCRANPRLPPTDPAPILWSIQDGLDPDTAAPLAGNRPQEMTLDQFISITIAQVDGVDLTVGDVIDYLANVAGAVHHGRPGTPKEIALASLESSMRVGGYPPAVRSLLAIARVTSKALQPLRSAILSDRPGFADPPT